MATDQVIRCPQCRSVFRVLPEQLTQAQGWLRCGQCHHVFDSNGLVLTLPEDEAPAPRVDLNEFLQAEDRGSPATTAPVVPPTPSGVDNVSSDALLSFEQALASFPGPSVRAQEQYATAVSALASDNVTDQGRARWGAIALFVLLLLQIFWIMRPWWQTDAVGVVLQRSCEWLHCNVPALRDPEQLLIDGSRLVRTEDGYRVEWTLRNRSAWPQRMPALELTLTGETGEVMVRRVFQPSEMSAPVVLEPAQAWEAELVLQWPQELNVSGYKLLVFHP